MCKKIARLMLGVGLLPVVAQAGGLYLYEIGTIDTSFASAGMAARAEDASTIYSNPAGMTWLDGQQMSLGLQGLYGDAEYQLENPELKDSGNVMGWIPGASAFYSHSIDDHLKLGLGIYGNFGSSLDFDDDWAGRYLVTETTLMALTIQPTAAYTINEHWSVGLGITANYGIFSLKRSSITGENTAEDHDWGYGARLGVMYMLSDVTRFGLVWGSAAKFDFDLEPTVQPKASLLYNVQAPQNMMFSGYHRLNDNWAIMGNLGWQDWSQFSNTTVSVDGNDKIITIPLKVEDTWHLAFGGQYSLNEKTKLNAGIAYDSSFYQDQNDTSFTLPSGEAWRFGVGAQYNLSNSSDFNFALEYIALEGSSSTDPLSGYYDDTGLVAISMQYNHHF